MFPKGRGVLPEIKTDTSPFFEGHDILKAGLYLSFDGLKKFKVLGSANAATELEKAKYLHYHFEDLKSQFVNRIELDKHLNHTKPDDTTSFLDKLQSGKIFIVTEVLRTTAFCIRRLNEKEFNLDMGAEALQKTLGEITANAERERNSSKKMSYKSNTLITFALRACKVLYDKNKKRYSVDTIPLKSVRSSGQKNTEELQVHTLKLS